MAASAKKYVLRDGYKFIDVKTNQPTDQTEFTGAEAGFKEQAHKFELAENVGKRATASPNNRMSGASVNR